MHPQGEGVKKKCKGTAPIEINICATESSIGREELVEVMIT